MLWTWLSVSIVLIGGKLNAEIEHQTARDTTVGQREPMGKRVATVADNIGRSSVQDR
jgi:membrane protein